MEKHATDGYWLREDMFNYKLTDDERFAALKKRISKLESSLNIALTDNVHKTKPQPTITQEELREIYNEQKNGNEELANKMIKELKRNGINK